MIYGIYKAHTKLIWYEPFFDLMLREIDTGYVHSVC